MSTHPPHQVAEHSRSRMVPNDLHMRFALAILLVLNQTSATIVKNVEWSAAALLLTLLIIGIHHKKCPPILIFIIFNIPIAVEPLITEWLDLSYYYLANRSNIPTVLLAQTVATIPLLVIKPLPVPILRPIFNGTATETILLIIGFILVSFGIKGNLALGDYSTYQKNLEAGSGIIEYMLILLTVIASFNKKKASRYIFAILIVFYTTKCALLGFRVQAIMGAMAFIILLMPSLSPIKIVLFSLLGGAIGLTLGALKHSTDFDLQALVLNNDYIQTPYGGSITSSTVGIDTIHAGPMEFMSVPLAMLIPRGVTGELIPWAYPMVHVQSFSPTPGGMLFGTYGLLVMNLAGPFVVGILIAIIANQLRPSRGAIRIFLMYSASTFFVFSPRWVLYDFGAYGIRIFFTTLLSLLIIRFVVASQKVKTYNSGHKAINTNHCQIERHSGDSHP